MSDDITNPTEIKEIQFEDVRNGLQDGSLILVDVRNPSELESQGKIPGAVNIPLPEVPDVFNNLTEDEFQQRFGFQKTAKIAFSCRSGARAAAAIENLKQFNNNIWLYKGSFTDWVNKGGEIA